jgi:hypothetical protein
MNSRASPVLAGPCKEKAGAADAAGWPANAGASCPAQSNAVPKTLPIRPIRVPWLDSGPAQQGGC